MHLKALISVLPCLAILPAASPIDPTYLCTGTQTSGFIRDDKGELKPSSSNPLLNFIVYPHALSVAEEKLSWWDQGTYRVKVAGDNNSFSSCFELGAPGHSETGVGTIECQGGDSSTIQKFTLFESNLAFEFENVNAYLDGDGNRIRDNPYIEIGKCDIIFD